MVIPPITLYEEEQALQEVLRALGKKASALAAYTAADAKKIQSMIDILESRRSPTLTPEEMADIIRFSSASLAATNLMQIILHSNLEHLLEQLKAEPLSHLIELPANKSCTIRASGQGQISNHQDQFYLGKAKLITAYLSARGADSVCGNIKYRVEQNGHYQELEAATSDLRLALIGPVSRRSGPSRPNIAWVTGYGITKKFVSPAECKRGVAWFSLTLWDYGGRKKRGKFRMAIYNPQNSFFDHDSGIVVQ